MTFELMHKDTPVALVTPGNAKLHVVEIYDKTFLPIGTRKDLDAIDDNMTTWNNRRCIPFIRPNYQGLMNEYNIKSSVDWLALSYMCSLTDSYWYRPSDSHVLWSEVNFHNNDTDSSLYKRLFYQQKQNFINFNSPDLTTNGAFPKYWDKRDGTFCLIKTSDTGKIANNEVFASTVMDILGVEHVEYKIEQDPILHKPVSVCPIFTNHNEDFIPMADIFQDYRVPREAMYSFMENMKIGEFVDMMFAVDFAIANIDRHTENYGLIIDSDTQKIKKMAPLFDNGTLELKTLPQFVHSSLGNIPFVSMLNNIETIPDWVFDEKICQQIKDEIAKIPHFDEEDISIAKTRLDERFAILQERALSIRKDRDDWLSELAKLGEFDR